MRRAPAHLTTKHVVAALLDLGTQPGRLSCSASAFQVPGPVNWPPPGRPIEPPGAMEFSPFSATRFQVS